MERNRREVLEELKFAQEYCSRYKSMNTITNALVEAQIAIKEDGELIHDMSEQYKEFTTKLNEYLTEIVQKMGIR